MHIYIYVYRERERDTSVHGRMRAAADVRYYNVLTTISICYEISAGSNTMNDNRDNDTITNDNTNDSSSSSSSSSSSRCGNQTRCHYFYPHLVSDLLLLAPGIYIHYMILSYACIITQYIRMYSYNHVLCIYIYIYIYMRTYMYKCMCTHSIIIVLDS